MNAYFNLPMSNIYSVLGFAMTQHYGLYWDKFESNICSKFADLQQNGEFVDLTLAADGHLVRVHQLILGIASPYIKELIHSAPCKHPVIFLNNISFSTLSYILQYVYTGEVAIDEEQLSTFFQAAKALQIQGLGSTDCPDQTSAMPALDPGIETVQIEIMNDVNTISTHYENVAVPISAKNIKISTSIPKNISTIPLPSKGFTRNNNSSDQKNKLTELTDMGEIETLDEDLLSSTTAMARCSRKDSVEDFELTGLVQSTPATLTTTSNELQYTVSIRGSLQLILNRYIYNLFSKSGGGKVRRWRCVDYKVQKCPACTVTSGDMVVKRINMHNHPYHDSKILTKIRKKAVFSAIKSIINIPNSDTSPK